MLNTTRFLRLILGAVGVTTACTGTFVASGCGGKVVVDAASSGGGAGNGGAGGEGQSSSSSGGGVIDCAPHLVSSQQTSPEGTCVTDPNAFSVNINCFAPPAAPATCADAYTTECILSTYQCGFSNHGDSIACGPMPDATGACCYVIVGDCPIGRPFTIDGHARLGALIAGGDWHADLTPDLSTLDARTRAALADAWGREALFEHASIASFARFVLQLLALGAPSDLVADAHRALADEHEHARACLGLASAYAGTALRPGPLAIDGALADCTDAAAIAASLASEGCVAETIAALQAQRAHEEARDPVVKAALGRIAEQEANHAILAWRSLGWMLGAGGHAVRAAVTKVFAEAEAHASLGAITDHEGDVETMRAHGYLPIEERRALAREALGRIVGPAATALLATPAKGRDSASQPLFA
ncbi:MAG: ferritin-like domain-containing protein [Minicystis sp.]